MNVFWAAVSVFLSGLVGVLLEWLLIRFLPTTPKVRHLVAGGVALLCLAVLAAYLSLGGINTGETLLQQGSVALPKGGDYEVFYPIHYAAPPNLVLEQPETSTSGMEKLEQRADGFTFYVNIVMPSSPAPQLKWTAKGRPALRQ